MCWNLYLYTYIRFSPSLASQRPLEGRQENYPGRQAGGDDPHINQYVNTKFLPVLGNSPLYKGVWKSGRVHHEPGMKKPNSHLCSPTAKVWACAPTVSDWGCPSQMMSVAGQGCGPTYAQILQSQSASTLPAPPISSQYILST